MGLRAIGHWPGRRDTTVGAPRLGPSTGSQPPHYDGNAGHCRFISSAILLVMRVVRDRPTAAPRTEECGAVVQNRTRSIGPAMEDIKSTSSAQATVSPFSSIVIQWALSDGKSGHAPWRRGIAYRSGSKRYWMASNLRSETTRRPQGGRFIPGTPPEDGQGPRHPPPGGRAALCAGLDVRGHALA